MMRTISRLALVLLVASLVFFELPFWFSPHLQEQGDLAANALQVERAREFHEFMGPYSQHGFHHPGPISFYYFAVAQTLLGFLPSILARHMLAQLGLNLLCLVGILRLLRKSGLEPPLVAAGGFLLAGQVIWLGGGTPLMLSSVWGPMLVVFPVVIFVVSAARLTSGDLTWLPVAVLAATVAFHNHLPSSTALSTVVVTVAILLGLRWRRIKWSPNGTRRMILLALSLLLLVLALVPTVVEQAKTDPGNLTLLWRYFSTHGPELHPWSEVIDKLGQALTDPLVVLGAWMGWKIHSPFTVLFLLLFLLAVSVVQMRRSSRPWRMVILFTWVTLIATVITARSVPGNLHTYLFYYLYGLVGLLQLFVAKEIFDRWVAHRLKENSAPAVILAGVLFFLPWVFFHRGEPPPVVDRYAEMVTHFDLEDVAEIHLFVDNAIENDQVWSALPTLALRFRRDGVRPTVPAEYVFLCGEEMRPDTEVHPVTLVITRRRPPRPDERYLPGRGWGIFLLKPEDGNPAEFLAGLPWMD